MLLPPFFFAFPHSFTPFSRLGDAPTRIPIAACWHHVASLAHSLGDASMDKGTHLDDTTLIVLVSTTLVLVLLALAAGTACHIYFT